jgi:hypothetical protein
LGFRWRMPGFISVLEWVRFEEYFFLKKGIFIQINYMCCRLKIAYFKSCSKKKGNCRMNMLTSEQTCMLHLLHKSFLLRLMSNCEIGIVEIKGNWKHIQEMKRRKSLKVEIFLVITIAFSQFFYDNEDTPILRYFVYITYFYPMCVHFCLNPFAYLKSFVKKGIFDNLCKS